MATAEEIRIRITAQDSATQVIKETNREMQTLSRTATSTGTATTKFGGNLSVMGRTAGQAGIQVQQLVGQIQGGTNPMLALSQQAADLGFVLGAPLIGAIVALGASIAMNLIPSFFEAEKSTKDLVKEIDELRARTGQLTQAQRNLIKEDVAKQAEEQRKEVDRLSKAIKANEAAAISLRLAQEAAQLDPEAAGIIDYEKEVADLYQKRITLVNQLSVAEDRLKVLEAGRTAEGDKFIVSLRDQVAMLGKSRADTIAYQASLLALTPAQKEQVEALIQSIAVYDRAQEQLKGNSSELEKLAQVTDFSNKQMDKAAAEGLKSMEDGLVGLIMQTQSVSQAFKNMATSILADILRMQVRKSITAPLAGFLDQSIGSFDFSSILPSFAGGGFTGAGSRSGGMDGLGGFPAMLHPNETVIDHRAGMPATAPAASQPVQITYNIQSWDSRDTMAAIQQSAPQIVGIVQNAFNKRGRRGPMG
jgi:uncharacterized protein YdhG (YjbR/CyaY superfamily)